MEKYIIAPPAGSQTNAIGAKDRPWEEVHAKRYPGLNEYLAESTGYGIVSGCEPSINGLTVTVSAGVIHTSDGRRVEVPEQSITLDAADATKPRTDIVYLDKYGKIAKLTGELGTPAVAGSNTYTISTNFAAGDTVTFGGVVFTCTSSTQDATNFALGADTATSATNLATALNANSSINAIYTASTSGSVVTITEKSAGGGNTPGAMMTSGTGVVTAGSAVSSTTAFSIAPGLMEAVIKVGEIAIKVGAVAGAITASYNHYKTATITYHNVSMMRQDRSLMPGMVAHTLGYYEPNDGGGAVYIIRSKKESDVDDGGSILVLDNGNVAELLIDGAVNVKQFGAKGDGTTDDTMSINNALALGKNTVFPQATYLVSSPLILQPYTCVDLCSSIIVGSNADADIFLFSRELNPTESLTLQNGIIQGKYTNAIHLKGKNEWEHAPNNYAHKVRIDNILSYCDADAPDENTFLFLDTACKRLNITRCGAETKNCIISNGKTVESFISGCMLYATGSTGYAVKVYSDFTNGNRIKWMYAEGLKFVHCEIDNPNNKGVSFLISDSFVTLIENCYVGCSMKIAPPINTTSNTDIIIADNVFYGATLSIGDSNFAKNNIYRCKVVNNDFDNSHIMIYEGANIDIANNIFYTGDSYIYNTAIYLGRNSNNITIHDNSIYGEYKIGVICKGSPINAAVYNIDYNGIGDYGLYIEEDTKNTVYRHHIRGGENPVMYKNIPPNSEIDVGGTIASVTVSLAKGQTGYITGVINTSEATSDARIMVGAPDNKIGILHGEKWDSRFIYVDNGTKRISIRIPFKCTDDFSGTIQLINSIDGKSEKITTSYHSYFGVELT